MQVRIANHARPKAPNKPAKPHKVVAWDFDGPISHLSQKTPQHLRNKQCFEIDNPVLVGLEVANLSYLRLTLDILDSNNVKSVLASQRCVMPVSMPHRDEMYQGLNHFFDKYRLYLREEEAHELYAGLVDVNHSKNPFLDKIKQKYQLAPADIILVDDYADTYKANAEAAGYQFIHVPRENLKKTKESKHAKNTSSKNASAWETENNYLFEILFRAVPNKSDVLRTIKILQSTRQVDAQTAKIFATGFEKFAAEASAKMGKSKKPHPKQSSSSNSVVRQHLSAHAHQHSSANVRQHSSANNKVRNKYFATLTNHINAANPNHHASKSLHRQGGLMGGSTQHDAIASHAAIVSTSIPKLCPSANASKAKQSAAKKSYKDIFSSYWTSFKKSCSKHWIGFKNFCNRNFEKISTGTGIGLAVAFGLTFVFPPAGISVGLAWIIGGALVGSLTGAYAANTSENYSRFSKKALVGKSAKSKPIIVNATGASALLVVAGKNVKKAAFNGKVKCRFFKPEPHESESQESKSSPVTNETTVDSESRKSKKSIPIESILAIIEKDSTCTYRHKEPREKARELGEKALDANVKFSINHSAQSDELQAVPIVSGSQPKI